MLLAGSEELIRRRLLQSPTIGAFCVEFKLLVENAIAASHARHSTSAASVLPPATFYSRILEEITALGWDMIQELSNEFDRVSLMLFDSSGRQHILKISFPSDYPVSAPICSLSLPSTFEPKWAGRTSSLLDIVEQYSAQLETYQDIWKVLDDIDDHTTVIEPLQRTRSDMTRRISISKFCSLSVEFSASNPFGVPLYSLMGSEATIGPMRAQMMARIHEWDYAKTPRVNFERILSLSFPAPSSESLADEAQEPCAICYGYRVDGQIPDQLCLNTSCARPYHARCLYDWLSSIQTTSRATSATIWGACPYCEQKISVRNPSTK